MKCLAVLGRAALLLALVFVLALLTAAAQAQTPLATPWQEAHAPLEIDTAADRVTVRSVATDRLQLCIEPRAGTFGPTRCFRVGDVRAGRVEVRR